jgi:hypothetical protein
MLEYDRNFVQDENIFKEYNVAYDSISGRA